MKYKTLQELLLIQRSQQSVVISSSVFHSIFRFSDCGKSIIVRQFFNNYLCVFQRMVILVLYEKMKFPFKKTNRKHLFCQSTTTRKHGIKSEWMKQSVHMTLYDIVISLNNLILLSCIIWVPIILQLKIQKVQKYLNNSRSVCYDNFVDCLYRS